MPNCINCSCKLNPLNETYPLWPETEDRLCSRCRQKVIRYLSEYSVSFENGQLTEDIVDKLSTKDLSPACISYLSQYALWIEDAPRRREERLRQEKEKAANQQNFLSTTGLTFSGYQITKYLGIKSGEVVFGTGFFSEFSASISDFLGSKSLMMAKKLSSARKAALDQLFCNCRSSGANAVIGVDFDLMTIGENMIVMCANGTAVIVEQECDA